MQIKLDFIKKYAKNIQRVAKTILNFGLKIMALNPTIHSPLYINIKAYYINKYFMKPLLQKISLVIQIIMF